MAERIDVVVIGAGQAGLATSHELTRLGVEHVVLERGRVAQSWRGRWDSFCLVTPNWFVQLPGQAYEGDDPDGFLPRDEIVEWLERYGERTHAPVREGVAVTALSAESGGGIALDTSGGAIRARVVVVATGAYQRPYRPAGASPLPSGLPQIDVQQYRNPPTLPPGKVLIVGSGQSGCQIAEEILGSGRETFLACGRAPWVPRRLGDHDLAWWAVETGFLDQPLSALASPGDRLVANVLATGQGGGHDLNLRTLRDAGVILLGHFLGADEHQARFAPDLAESVAWGDERHRDFMNLVHELVEDRRLPMPDVPEPGPFDGSAPERLDLSGFGVVVFTGGFRPDYRSWVRVPGAFDDLGFPVHTDGASSTCPGLYFVGVHFLRKRKSSLLGGVGEDAAIVAEQVAQRRGEER